MTDFWRNSGFHLLQRRDDGGLGVTEDFIRAYLMRPEVRPVEESCDAERALHESLMANPREAVSDDRLAKLADPDARNNYRLVLAFRDRLLAAGSVEGCYLGLFTDDRVTVPPLFIDQMAHVILRNILDGVEDALRLRAAELLYRPQKVNIDDGTIMAADAETIDMYAATGGFGGLGRLLVEAQTPVRTVELDVLGEENADLYWARDEKYDTVIDLSFARPGLDALCRVLEAWIGHFLGVAVSMQPVQEVSDQRWVWHVGLDAEASGLLNDLYEGNEVDDARMTRLLSLFRMDFADRNVMLPDIAGRPVYLAMCMNEAEILHLKPQNLLVNLPLATPA